MIGAGDRRTLSRLSPFRSLSLPVSAADQRRIAEAHAAAIRPAVVLDTPPGGSPAAPVHVAYLSPDFRDHPVGHLLAGLFARHDRARVRVTAYAIGPADTSSWRRRIAADADAFVDLAGLDDAAAARRIHADGAHILVDLAGHTEYARPRIAASRPAAVTVAWLGYPGTTGAPFVDYLLADWTVIPPGAEADFTETVVRLPVPYQANDDAQRVEPAPVRGRCGLPEGVPVLCCFNAAYKITPDAFDAWARIMGRVPPAVLWLLGTEPEVEANLRAAAAARGIDPGRLVFAGRLPKAAHLGRLALADVFLDTWPYNAHTTASDALRVAVPVVTMAGATFASRVAASLLRGAGAPQLVAPDLAAYEDTAVRLLLDPPSLAAAKRAVREGSARLLDTAAFVRHLEQAFSTMLAAGRRQSNS
jgi:predicted O-linked N-acetylglucosamine transferase (SPINDLY family)